MRCINFGRLLVLQRTSGSKKENMGSLGSLERNKMKLFESKYDKWWDSLPKNTQIYLKSQPIWHDSDLVRAGLMGLAIGIFLGAAIF